MKKTILISILFIPVLASAQVPVNPRRHLEEIQRRQQQETQQMLRAREVDAAKRAQETSARAAAPQEAQEAEPEGCLDIKKVSISGVKKISHKKVKKEVTAKIKPCMNKQDLQEIQTLVQQMYVQKGYIGARIYFDFSEVKQNVLHIVAAEGFLEEIIMETQDGRQKGLRTKMQIWDAFPSQKGKIVNLRNIEQGLDQMNKLQSNNVTMDVRPGDKDGGSVVHIKNQKGDATQITASYDNAGSQSTGRYRGTLSLSQDNLISLNDNLFINASSTLWNNRSLRYSHAITANLNVPLGYWTFSNSLSYSRYLTTTEGLVSSFESNGNSINNTFNIERMMMRAASYKLSMGGQLAVKKTENWLEDVLLDTSSHALTAGSFYLTGTYYSGFGSIYSKLSYNRGLSLFGSLKDIEMVPGKPSAEFDSVSLYVNYSKDLWQKISYTMSVDAQYTKDDLFSSEQMLLGGEGTVRGFRDNSISGEKGFYIRNDLRISAHSVLGESRNPWMSDLFQKTYFGVFADYGYIKPQTFGESGTMAGAGAKISYYGKYINGNAAWAKSITRPDYLDSEGNIFYFNIALNLSF
jgi:hemolysin activation/secretion protein